jgi:hypothetical protein
MYQPSMGMHGLLPCDHTMVRLLWCGCSAGVAGYVCLSYFVLLVVHVMHLICAELLRARLVSGRESRLLLFAAASAARSVPAWHLWL